MNDELKSTVALIGVVFLAFAVLVFILAVIGYACYPRVQVMQGTKIMYTGSAACVSTSSAGTSTRVSTSNDLGFICSLVTQQVIVGNDITIKTVKE